MQKAILIPVEGKPEMIKPANGKSFDYRELQKIVGGIIQEVPMPQGLRLVINDEGVFEGLPVNETAGRLWRKLWPIEQFPVNNPGVVLGNAVLFGRDLENLINTL